MYLIATRTKRLRLFWLGCLLEYWLKRDKKKSCTCCCCKNTSTWRKGRKGTSSTSGWSKRGNSYGWRRKSQMVKNSSWAWNSAWRKTGRWINYKICWRMGSWFKGWRQRLHLSWWLIFFWKNCQWIILRLWYLYLATFKNTRWVQKF